MGFERAVAPLWAKRGVPEALRSIGECWLGAVWGTIPSSGTLDRLLASRVFLGRLVEEVRRLESFAQILRHLIARSIELVVGRKTLIDMNELLGLLGHLQVGIEDTSDANQWIDPLPTSSNSTGDIAACLIRTWNY